MAMTPEREYRMMPMMEIRKAEDEQDKSCRVEGYASTFEAYELYNDGEIVINERIEPTAFDGCDMSDVLFLYNHEGRVLARQKNGTLDLTVDEHGLKVVADLGSTERSREMYEDIRTGLIDQMSFAFTVADESFERDTHTRVIKRMRKLYDVSAVSVPANPTTSIASRSAIDGAIEALKQAEAERLRQEQRAADIENLKKLLEV